MRRLLLAASSVLLVIGTVPIVASPAQAVQAPVAFSATDLPTWQTNGVAWSVASANGLVFVGGTFTNIRPPGAADGVSTTGRTNFAVFDAATGNPTSCAPSFSGGSSTVRALDVSPDNKTLYVGGYFSSAAGSARQHLAALDIASCTVVSSFQPRPNATVRAIDATSTKVYFGGAVGSVAGVSRGYAAAVDAVGTSSPGALLPWAPVLDNEVRAVAVSPNENVVVVGGNFDLANSAASRGLVVTNNSNGANVRTYGARWITSASSVKGIAVDSTGFYTAHEGMGGGQFDGRNAFDWGSYDQRWRDNCLGATQSVLVHKGVLYSANHAHNCYSMDSFPDGPRMHFTAQRVNDPKLLSWFPNTNEGLGEGIGPRGLALGSKGGVDYLWSVGEFTRVNGKAQVGITRFGPTPDTAPSTPVISLTTPRAGEVRVAWRPANDPDDATLTYNVYRDNGTTPIHTVTGDSWFWQRPQMTFLDPQPAGSTHTYRVSVSDQTTTRYTPWRSVTVASTGSGYAARVIADGATALWRFDEPSDVLVSDTTSNGNSLTIQGGATYQVTPAAIAGDPSRALTFGGTSTTAYSERRFDDPNFYSLETWVRTTSTSGGKIIGFGDKQVIDSGVDDRHIYMTDNGRFVFGVDGGSRVVLQSATGFNNGAWHHVVATQGSSGMSLYVNGTRVANNSTTSNGNVDGYWRLGCDSLSGWPSAPSSWCFGGSVDETAVYPSALSAATVAAHYDLGRNGAGPITPPSTPGPVTAGLAAGNVQLSWPAATGGASPLSYEVHRSGTAGFTPSTTTRIAVVSTTSAVDTAVGNGTWYYRVVARDANGILSAPSGAVSISVGDVIAPTAPTALSATAATDDVSLSWTAATDNIGVVGYDVHRSESEGFTPNASNLVGSTAVPSFLDEQVGDGTWFYRVIARDGAGNVGAASNEASAVLLNPSAPSTPSGVVATASGATVTVAWQDSTDDVGVTGYDVHRSSSPSFAATAANLIGSTETTSHVAAVPTSGTWYYRVVARDAAGNRSAASVVASVDVTVPGPPEVVSLNPTADTYANQGAAGTNYGSESSFAARTTNPAYVSYLRFAIPAAPAGKTLTGASLRLRTSSSSSAGTVDAPEVQRASDTWSETTLTWNNRPALTPGVIGTFPVAANASTEYTAPLTTSAIAPLVGTQATLAVTDPGADSVWFWSRNHATTSFRPVLELTYGAGGSQPDPGDTTAPTAPTALSAEVDDNDVALSWTASTDAVGVTGYAVHRGTSAGFAPTAANRVGTPPGTSFTDTDAEPGTWYYVVVARDAAGNTSAVSNEVTAEVAATGAPTVVSLVPTADTYANQGAAATNYGSTSSFAARDVAPSYVSYLRFDLPAAPDGKTLTGATLRLRTSDNASAPTVGAPEVQLAANSWTETGLTWNNRPALTPGVIGSFPAGLVASTTYGADLTATALRPLVGSETTLAVTLPGDDSTWFWSRNHPTASFRPELVLTYR